VQARERRSVDELPARSRGAGPVSDQGAAFVLARLQRLVGNAAVAELVAARSGNLLGPSVQRACCAGCASGLDCERDEAEAEPGSLALRLAIQRHAIGTTEIQDDSTGSGAFDLQGAGTPEVTGAHRDNCKTRTKEVKPPRPTAADADLTDAQVASAIAFYRSLPGRYTRSVMEELQSAVSADPTGVPDEQTVRAVATVQAADPGEPPLKVDGKAGPRTLPRLFHSGLNTAASEQQFAKDAVSVQHNWTTLGTPAARAKALLDAVNVRLVNADVRALKFNFVDLDGCAVGQLNIAHWGMDLLRGSFDRPAVTDEQARDVANTVYHEARHGQQWFQMARYLAGQNFSVGAIRATLGMDKDAAKEAHDKKLLPGSVEAVIAQNWYESFYGTGTDYNDRIDEASAAIQALHRAEEAFEKDPSPANRARVEAAARRRDVAMRRYRDHPVEDDAFATANAMSDDMKGAQTSP